MWWVFSLMSLVVFPWGLALLLVSHLGAVYAALSPSQLLMPIAFGAGWGVAQILFGISVARLGLGIAYAIIVGIGAVLGTLVPLLAAQHNAVSSRALFLVLAGVSVMVLGVAITAREDHLKDQTSEQATRQYNAAVTQLRSCLPCSADSCSDAELFVRLWSGHCAARSVSPRARATVT